MRKIILAGFAVSALISAHRAAIAATVSDYTYFTNNTSETWTQSSYTLLGSGETMGYQGPTSVAAGHWSDSYYYAPAQTNSAVQIVWTSTVDGTACTFNFSTQLNQYGNWQRYLSATASGPRASTVKYNAPPVSSGPSSGYTVNYSVSF